MDRTGTPPWWVIPGITTALPVAKTKNLQNNMNDVTTIDVTAQSFTLLLRAIIRVDLLRVEGSPRSLPFDDLRSLFSETDNSSGASLRFTQAIQLALARAAYEKWTHSQLES